MKYYQKRTYLLPTYIYLTKKYIHTYINSYIKVDSHFVSFESFKKSHLFLRCSLPSIVTDLSNCLYLCVPFIV